MQKAVSHFNALNVEFEADLQEAVAKIMHQIAEGTVLELRQTIFSHLSLTPTASSRRVVSLHLPSRF
jgi:flagellar basal body rod protein FlgB